MKVLLLQLKPCRHNHPKHNGYWQRLKMGYCFELSKQETLWVGCWLWAESSPAVLLAQWDFSPLHTFRFCSEELEDPSKTKAGFEGVQERRGKGTSIARVELCSTGCNPILIALKCNGIWIITNFSHWFQQNRSATSSVQIQCQCP